MGRAGLVEHEIGSALVDARLVRDTMRRCFLKGRSYALLPQRMWLHLSAANVGGDVTPGVKVALQAAT